MDGVKVTLNQSDGEVGRLINELLVALVNSGMALDAGEFTMQIPFVVEDLGAEWSVTGSKIVVSKKGVLQ